MDSPTNHVSTDDQNQLDQLDHRDHPDHRDISDVLIVGGGPAGLQAALTLGRIHRSVTVVDSGAYRNASVDHMHNVLTHDGRPPGEFRSQARAQLEPYDVRVLSAYVTRINGDVASGFTAELDDGGPDEAVIRARRIVLATGLRDELPEIPGLSQLWGTVAAQCPFCHGHEFADGHVAVLGATPQAGHLVAMMRRIAGRLTVLADGDEIAEDTRRTITALGADIASAKVERIEPTPRGARVLLSDGSHLEVTGILLAPTFHQAAPFAGQLGLRLLDSGCVEIDDFGRTSVPGVFAGGDLAHRSSFPMPMPSVISSMAAGQMAAAAAVQDLLVEELAALPS